MSALPREIQVDRFSDEHVRYRLPRKRTAMPWPLAAAMFCFGLSWTLLPGCTIVGFALTVSSVWLAAGHSVVELRRGRLYAWEGVGWLGIWHRRATNGITRLIVRQPPAADPDGAATPSLGPWHVLVETTRYKPMRLAVGYPMSWLAALSHELAAQMTLMAACDGDESPIGPEVKIECEPETELPPVERPEQPADSRIVVERFPDAVTLMVPAAGFGRGTRVLLIGGVLCLLLSAWLMAQCIGRGPDWANARVCAAFTLMSGTAGVTMVMAAVNAAGRRAALAVAGDQLLAIQIDLFGGKRCEWLKHDVRRIRAAESATSGKNRALGELQIVSAAGDHFGLLSGREWAELEWMATVLRRALDLAAAQPVAS